MCVDDPRVERGTRTWGLVGDCALGRRGPPCWLLSRRQRLWSPSQLALRGCLSSCLACGLRRRLLYDRARDRMATRVARRFAGRRGWTNLASRPSMRLPRSCPGISAGFCSIPPCAGAILSPRRKGLWFFRAPAARVTGPLTSSPFPTLQPAAAAGSWRRWIERCGASRRWSNRRPSPTRLGLPAAPDLPRCRRRSSAPATLRYFPPSNTRARSITFGDAFNIDSATACACSPVEGLMSIFCFSASARKSASFIMVLKA
jgi:hypothetical protein